MHGHTRGAGGPKARKAKKPPKKRERRAGSWQLVASEAHYVQTERLVKRNLGIFSNHNVVDVLETNLPHHTFDIYPVTFFSSASGSRCRMLGCSEVISKIAQLYEICRKKKKLWLCPLVRAASCAARLVSPAGPAEEGQRGTHEAGAPSKKKKKVREPRSRPRSGRRAAAAAQLRSRAGAVAAQLAMQSRPSRRGSTTAGACPAPPRT